ncbi:MAG: hydroxyacid dehydrogenase [Candidatus Dormibacter sp.]|uniref:hydroxyacid dehydrogenase n=1 Tax=Candidatus Dormibacter sp. TaxID=2973982 RepID=UPI000DB30310|nr:MAG: dehydrogenase [Candidatus Dormibacteraeota bacterium]
MAKILLIHPMYHPDGEALLRAGAQVEVVGEDTVAALLPQLADAEAIIVRTPSRVGADTIAAAPRLRVISTSGYGTDNIDIPAATEAGVVVVNNPGSAENSVAEHAVALVLALAKKLTWSDAAVRSGQPWDFRGGFEAIELKGRTLGVVGFGRIGREVARKLHDGFGMEVVVYDTLLAETTLAPWARQARSVEELLPQADVVTIHCALTPQTRHLFDQRRLALMRRGALLINTARGPVVDETALAAALRSGTLGGAGIDVYESEPPAADNPLFELENVILTAHTAGLTVESARQLALSAAAQVLATLDGVRPANLVNPEVWERRRGAAGALVGR